MKTKYIQPTSAKIVLKCINNLLAGSGVQNLDNRPGPGGDYAKRHNTNWDAWDDSDSYFGTEDDFTSASGWDKLSSRL